MLAEHFDRYFTLEPVRDAAARREVFRLRYAVYCDELRYEDVSAFPDGEESDLFDDASAFALLRHRATARAVGCVRLVLGAETPRFPFEHGCAGRLDPALFDAAALDRAASGEISRLAIHRDFRRRRGEWQSPEAVGDPEDQAGGQRRYPLLPMSLFLAATALAMNRGLAQVFVLMEPRLARLLSSCGIRFVRIGELVEFHGARAPFRITRDELLVALPPDGRELLERMRATLA